MIEGAVWLSYAPAYSTPRGRMTAVLGAHSFVPGEPRSVCGCAPAAKAGGPAPADARKCTWCERVLEGKSKPRQ